MMHGAMNVKKGRNTSGNNDIEVKVKLNILEEATKTHGGTTGIALLFL
jgi:hypothetical protein